MIEQIEHLESMMNNKPSQVIIDGLMCIHMCLDIAVTGNDDLIKAIENGRG
jgi:hypothetical protein